MAGETTKSANLTNTQAGTKRESRYGRGRLLVASDVDAIAAGELEAADVTLLDIEIPSNAIVAEIAVYNDDLDSNCTPTLAADVGLFAVEDFTSVTSSTATKHAADAVLDADAYVDGATDLQAATTKWTALAFDSATFGPDDAEKMAWEVLGYDEDPHTRFRVGVTFAAAAATAAAGDLGVRVKYIVD